MIGNRLASHLVKKSLGRHMIYPNMPIEELNAEVDKVFDEEKSYKKRETIYLANRNLAQYSPCKLRRKYWSDVKRHYDQKQVGFFVSQVLARKKIAIPLR